MCFPPLRFNNQENEILTEQEELISLEQVLRRQIATEKEEIERLRAEIADIQRCGKTETILGRKCVVT